MACKFTADIFPRHTQAQCLPFVEVLHDAQLLSFVSLIPADFEEFAISIFL